MHLGVDWTGLLSRGAGGIKSRRKPKSREEKEQDTPFLRGKWGAVIWGIIIVALFMTTPWIFPVLVMAALFRRSQDFQ